MTTTTVDFCPKCGADVVVPAVWHGVIPPIPQFTCGHFTNFGAQWVSTPRTYPTFPRVDIDMRKFGPTRKRIRDDSNIFEKLPSLTDEQVKSVEDLVDKINAEAEAKRVQEQVVQEEVPSTRDELAKLNKNIEDLTKSISDLTTWLKEPYKFTYTATNQPQVLPTFIGPAKIEPSTTDPTFPPTHYYDPNGGGINVCIAHGANGQGSCGSATASSHDVVNIPAPAVDACPVSVDITRHLLKD